MSAAEAEPFDRASQDLALHHDRQEKLARTDMGGPAGLRYLDYTGRAVRW